MTSGPLISVITPCFNDKEFIAEAVRSVAEQTYPNIEHIVIDDGSSDGSLGLLEDLAGHHDRLRVTSQANAGAAAARNHGLRLAAGECIAFLDADDYWAPECLAKLMGGLNSTEAVLAYCGWQNVGVEGGGGDPFVPPDYANVDRVELLLGGNRWPIHAALTRAEAIRAAGGFDEGLSSCMDYDLWLRIGSENPVVLVPQVLAYYRHHGGTQITKNRLVIATNHWRAQQNYLKRHPDTTARLGRRTVRELTLGELLHRAYTAYWQSDLVTARTLFRRVMAHRYGGIGDWKYMLPALLPLSWHTALINRLGRSG